MVNDLGIMRLHPSASERMWPRLMPLVVRFTDESGGTVTPDMVLRGLLSGAMDAFIIPGLRGILVTQFAEYAYGKTLVFVGSAGDEWEEWGPGLFKHAEDFGRTHGCKYVQIIGRGGWARKLQPFGWRKAAVITMKDL